MVSGPKKHFRGSRVPPTKTNEKPSSLGPCHIIVFGDGVERLFTSDEGRCLLLIDKARAKEKTYISDGLCAL